MTISDYYIIIEATHFLSSVGPLWLLQGQPQTPGGTNSARGLNYLNRAEIEGVHTL